MFVFAWIGLLDMAKSYIDCMLVLPFPGLFTIFGFYGFIYHIQNWLISPMNDSYSNFLDAFEDAVDAYYKEDYKTAHKLFLPLAEQGDDEAQFNLEMMHNGSLN